jgi:hypothetical protein
VQRYSGEGDGASRTWDLVVKCRAAQGEKAGEYSFTQIDRKEKVKLVDFFKARAPPVRVIEHERGGKRGAGKNYAEDDGDEDDEEGGGAGGGADDDDDDDDDEDDDEARAGSARACAAQEGRESVRKAGANARPDPFLSPSPRLAAPHSPAQQDYDIKKDPKAAKQAAEDAASGGEDDDDNDDDEDEGFKKKGEFRAMIARASARACLCSCDTRTRFAPLTFSASRRQGQGEGEGQAREGREAQGRSQGEVAAEEEGAGGRRN